jgi:lipopolysaccharide/colanic/teichoic acid biosynthesis glycosyltransferase
VSATGAPSQPTQPDQEALRLEYAQLVRSSPDARRVTPVLRILDIVFATCGLLLLSPLLLAALAAVRVTGKPVLYRGRRVGRGGELFTMFKIRTLPPDAEQRLGRYLGSELTRLTSTEVTRIGAILRATKIDEVPQLWNVLRGEMSVVGPRPIRPAFFLELTAEIPAYWQRLVVRPGITGLAQLRMTRETSWEDKLAHDLEYIADRSVSLYLHVVLVTAWLLLTHPLRPEHRGLRLP